MGLRSSRSAEIVFADCQVPAENRLGEEGQGLKIALEALDGGRVGIAAQAVGLAQGALDASVRYAKAAARLRQNDRRISGHSVYACGYANGDRSGAHAGVAGSVHARQDVAHERRRPPGASAALGAYASRAKLYATEMANRVAYKAVQIHGSMGYSRESDVERIYRDARVLSIYEGTSEIQRTIIARDLLSRPSREAL